MISSCKKNKFMSLYCPPISTVVESNQGVSLETFLTPPLSFFEQPENAKTPKRTEKTRPIPSLGKGYAGVGLKSLRPYRW